MGSHVLITLARRQQRKLIMKVFAVALAGLVGLAAGAQPKGLGLAIGGYGASNTIELVTPEGTCYGSDIDPPSPVAEDKTLTNVATAIRLTSEPAPLLFLNLAPSQLNAGTHPALSLMGNWW